MYETLDFTETGPVATITLRRPRIDVAQLKDLERVCDWLEDSSKATTVVLRGHSAGIDFEAFDPAGPLDIHGFNKWEKALRRLERLEQATVGVADGDCVGGGFQLLLACDVRVAVRSARFSLPEVKLGFLPGMATWRLARYVGLGHAKRIVLTGASLDTEEALRLGLIDRVVDDADQGAAEGLALLQPTHAVAISLARRLLLESAETQYEDALGNFLAAQHRAISQSAFMETLRKETKKERSGR